MAWHGGEEDLAAGPCGAAEARYYGGRAAALRCWSLVAGEQESRRAMSGEAAKERTKRHGEGKRKKGEDEGLLIGSTGDRGGGSCVPTISCNCSVWRGGGY